MTGYYWAPKDLVFDKKKTDEMIKTGDPDKNIDF